MSNNHGERDPLKSNKVDEIYQNQACNITSKGGQFNPSLVSAGKESRPQIIESSLWIEEKETIQIFGKTSMTRIRRSMKHLTKIFLLIPHIKPWNLENNSNKSLNLYVASKTKISDRPKKKAKTSQQQEAHRTKPGPRRRRRRQRRRVPSRSPRGRPPPCRLLDQISDLSEYAAIYTNWKNDENEKKARAETRAPTLLRRRRKEEDHEDDELDESRGAQRNRSFFFSERKDWGAFWASGTAAQGWRKRKTKEKRKGFYESLFFSVTYILRIDFQLIHPRLMQTCRRN